MNKYNKRIVILIIFFFFYLASKFLELYLLSDLVSLTGTLLACFLIFESIYKNARSDKLAFTVLLGIGCFTWSIAEVFRVIYIYIYPEVFLSNSIIRILCFLTNVAFLIAIVIFASNRFKNWNKIQLTLDFMMILTIFSYLIWAVFFDRGALKISIIINDGFISTASILTDLLMFTTIAVWYISVRGGKIPIVSRLINTGILIFALSNTFWFYLYFHGLLTFTRFDIVYILPIFLISIATIMKKKEYVQGELKYSEYSNIGGNKKIYFILISLIVLFIKDGLILTDIFFVAALILIYKASSAYIQFSINNERLLEKEKNITIELEKRIEERTRELTEKNELLNDLVNTDSITNLYNRRFFNIRIKELLANLKYPNRIAIFFINFNKFKSINDFYGHKIGDEIQIEVSKRLRTLNCSNDSIFIFLRDEFVIAMECSDSFDTNNFCEEIIQLFNEPFAIYNYSFDITVNIGITYYNVGDEADGDTLVNNANIAMFESQLLGPNLYLCFDKAMFNKMKRKNEIEMMLSKVNYDDEFELYYQPQFNIEENKLIGMEALLRWHNPKLGGISPAEFIHVSESTNDIIPIGKWVILNAVKQIAYWNNKYHKDLFMGINISPKQLFKDEQLIYHIKEACSIYNAHPRWLDIEITEGLSLIQNDYVFNLLSELKEMDTAISLDDFGTGYSSFNTFRYFPFNRIKLPKQFIEYLERNNHSYRVIKFFMAMSYYLNHRLIIEGVETREQYEMLREIGCKEVQGFYFGKPVPAKEFEERFIKNFPIDIFKIEYKLNKKEGIS